MNTPTPNTIYPDDNREILKGWPDACVDAVVTDPPYEIGLMGKAWDATGIAYDVNLWREVLRVMKPGAHLLAFGGTRTYHRMACAIEDAGFEIRDQIQWVYSTGFPKSLNISKAIDKAAGADRPVEGYKKSDKPNVVGKKSGSMSASYTRNTITSPQTDAAKQWDGWGTALKPANEPVVLARKPISENTVAANVLKWGTGALNIEAGRIPCDWESERGEAWLKSGRQAVEDGAWQGPGKKVPGSTVADRVSDAGRWPANLILFHHPSCVDLGEVHACVPDCPMRIMDGQSGVATSSGGANGGKLGASVYGEFKNEGLAANAGGLGDTGGASRFFYCPKPDGGERNMGVEANVHPTVKPVDLMAYLIKLVTPPGGIVLDPFMGSGTTGIAAARLGFPFLGCELNPEYKALAEKRIASETQQGKLF